MTVEEYFQTEQITLDLLLERSEENEYWDSCYNFISKYWKSRIEMLSPKQYQWLDKILEDMTEYRIENSGR